MHNVLDDRFTSGNMFMFMKDFIEIMCYVLCLFTLNAFHHSHRAVWLSVDPFILRGITGS